MHLLVDNTGIHRLARVLDSKPSEPIRGVDVLELLHFAEHLMFADFLLYSLAESPIVGEKTRVILDKLESDYGLTSGQEPLLRGLPIDVDLHHRACLNSIIDVRDKLIDLSPSELEHWCTLVDDASFPDTAKRGMLIQPLREPHDRMERSWEARERLRTEGALATLDVVLYSDEVLHAHLQRLLAAFNGPDSSLSDLLSILIRIAVNNQLAIHANAKYAPAPKRAGLANRSAIFVRSNISRRIQQLLSEDRNGKRRVRDTLTALQQTEYLPLPYFAIKFLKEWRPKGPHEIIEAALDLRKTAEVRMVRDLLRGLESSQDPQAELEVLWKQVERELAAPRRNGLLLRSVLLGLAERAGTTSTFRQRAIEELVRLWHRQFGQSSTLLSVVSDIRSDETLGLKVNAMLDRCLIP